jgi:Na+/H+ antiporter NhaD/arsenite permease-like protein
VERAAGAMTEIVVAVFALVYLGMILGGLPFVQLDRTGVALLGAIALVAFGVLTPEQAALSIHLPTLLLLFSFMVISAQMRLGGFYAWVTLRVAALPVGPGTFLAAVIVAVAALSAVFSNDVVCLAVAPVLAEACRRRGLDPVPFLLALACAANIGSAATLIGNPQNILIGQVGGLDFWRFVAVCGPPALAALVLVFVAVLLTWREALDAHPISAAPPPPAFDGWQTAKGIAAAVLLVALFTSPLPREIAALAVGAALLVSRRMATRRVMAAVDWHLILLFAALFIVNAAFAGTGLPGQAMAWLGEHGLLPDRLGVLAALALLASNTIGNVPAVIMLLAQWPAPPEGALYGLALLSTLAGNLLLVGSMANIIVAERAAAHGVRLGFGDFARSGIPMTLASFAVAIAWLGLGGRLGW